MDQNERQNKVTIDKDAQINVVVNRSGEEETTIDLGRVFHNMKVKKRVFAWVLVLCLVLGICAPLLLYQFNKPMLTVASAVTLQYEIPMVQDGSRQVPLAQYRAELKERGETEPDDLEITWMPVTDLTAPDGSELDLTRITSSYVLSKALNGMELSKDIPLSSLAKNISIERVLTEESRQAQELASKMTEDKSAEAYNQLQTVEMKYDCKFVVRLTNGFKKDNESKDLIEITDEELQTLLDRILAAYNDYLVETYADRKLPDDKLSVIGTDGDLLESLELLQQASDDLYDYCDRQRDSVKAYRSYRDGRSLEDWMKTIQTGREVAIDYLYSHVYTDTIVPERERQTTLDNYTNLLRTQKTNRDKINKNIQGLDEILEDYKNDEIFVSMQESDASKSTSTTTDYYNSRILEQADNYKLLAAVEIKIADLESKITSLKTGDTQASQEDVDTAVAELKETLENCRNIYDGVNEHMKELMASAFYTDYAEHTVPQGKLDNFLVANLKKMLIGAAVGAVLACGLWFLAALAPEFRRNRKEDDDVPEAGADGKEAARA